MRTSRLLRFIPIVGIVRASLTSRATTDGLKEQSTLSALQLPMMAVMHLMHLAGKLTGKSLASSLTRGVGIETTGVGRRGREGCLSHRVDEIRKFTPLLPPRSSRSSVLGAALVSMSTYCSSSMLHRVCVHNYRCSHPNQDLSWPAWPGNECHRMRING